MKEEDASLRLLLRVLRVSERRRVTEENQSLPLIMTESSKQTPVNKINCLCFLLWRRSVKYGSPEGHLRNLGFKVRLKSNDFLSVLIMIIYNLIYLRLKQISVLSSTLINTLCDETLLRFTHRKKSIKTSFI